MKLFQVWIEDEDIGNYLIKAEDSDEAIALAKQDEDIMRHVPEDAEFGVYEIVFKDTGVQDIAAECVAAYTAHLQRCDHCEPD